MASSRLNTHTEAAKMEQVITAFFYKSLFIILESRSPYVSSCNYSGEQTLSSPCLSSSSSSSVRPRDEWFNLALRECPSVLENHDLCRQSNFEPVVVDVILEQNLSSEGQNSFFWNSDQEETCCETKGEKIIERWFVQHEGRKDRDCSLWSRRSNSNNLITLYRKLILLLRSLYVTVRLLPAYNIFRDLNSSGQIRAFKLVPRVSSFVEPFTYKEEAEMHRFWFTPVDTSCGRLCLSVLYHSPISDVSSESSTPMSPQFIPDYVGSPWTDPLRRFPSLPVSSPSSLPLSRRHNWSFDHYKASSPSVSFSPSPTHSKSHALVSNPSSGCLQPMSLPPPSPETSLAHKKNTKFDEYYPFPDFSASPSPSPSPFPSLSPPIHIPGSHQSKALLTSESAPVNIPVPKLANSAASSSKQNLPPSPPLKISRVGISRTDNNMSPVKSGATMDTPFSFGKGDCHGVRLSFNSLPQISFSRSPGRSLQIGFDYSEYPCPFDVKDDDMMDAVSRPKSYDRTGHPSDQNEAVYALVRMLEKAPPLHQDVSSSINFSEASKPEKWSNSIQEQNQISEAATVEHAAPSIIASVTTADALEELQAYKEMKNLLLGEGGKSYTSANFASGAEYSSKGT